MRRFSYLWLVLLGLPQLALAQGGRTFFGDATREEEQVEVREAKGDSNVSFIDSAIPLNRIRTRYDLSYLNKRPTRAEFLYTKESFLLPETRVDQQEISTYGELAFSPWISVFFETPFRMVNPEVNRNISGSGDTSFGFKFSVFDTEMFLTTFQLRAYAPTHAEPILGNSWALEPALLANFKLSEYLSFEGEVRYWTALNDRPAQGNVLRYGLGVIYGHRTGDMVTIMPVAEFVGWTALGGQTDILHPDGSIETRSAYMSTILNGSLGFRTALGDVADVYLGYSRAFSGPAWYRDLFRLEVRFMY